MPADRLSQVIGAAVIRALRESLDFDDDQDDDSNSVICDAYDNLSDDDKAKIAVTSLMRGMKVKNEMILLIYRMYFAKK